jgi:hypothetical protein
MGRWTVSICPRTRRLRGPRVRTFNRAAGSLAQGDAALNFAALEAPNSIIREEIALAIFQHLGIQSERCLQCP